MLLETERMMRVIRAGGSEQYAQSFAVDIKIDVRVGTPDNIPERRIQSYVRNQFKSDQNQNLGDR